MPNFIKFGRTVAFRQYGEIYMSHTFYIFCGINLSIASTEKITKLFQVLNGLKCSTVSNLGS